MIHLKNKTVKWHVEAEIQTEQIQEVKQNQDCVRLDWKLTDRTIEREVSIWNN
jgi:hypothetical protein